jgi:hypothetical protein
MGAREMAALAGAVESVTTAIVAAWWDPSALSRAEVYGDVTALLLIQLAALAGVTLTVYVDEDATPGPQS